MIDLFSVVGCHRNYYIDSGVSPVAGSRIRGRHLFILMAHLHCRRQTPV